jgi:hypothetical protein
MIGYEFWCWDCAGEMYPLGRLLTSVDTDTPEGLKRFQDRIERHQRTH